MSIKSSFLGVVVMVTITYLRISNFAGLSNPGLNPIHRILWISIVSNLFLFNYCLAVPCMTYDCTLPDGSCVSFICCVQLISEALKKFIWFSISLIQSIEDRPYLFRLVETCLIVRLDLCIEIIEAPNIKIHTSNFTGKYVIKWLNS